MQRYILMRLLQIVVTLFALSLVIFLLARLSGNPVYLIAPVDATAKQFKELETSLGLDKPLYVQYGVFISNLFRGDLGKSVRNRIPVTDLLAARVPNSLGLAGVAMGFSVLMGFPLGVMAAVNRGKWPDTGARLIALLGQATPPFWLGIVLMILIAVQLRLLPTSGMGGPSHWILPGFTLGFYMTAQTVRLLRTSMLEVLDSEFVKLARIKGVSEQLVIWKHALRNALLAVVTNLGITFVMIITMAVVVEVVFRWPGVGRLVYEGIINRDYPVVQGVILFAGVLLMFANLLVDIIYAYLDPRIRY